MTLSQLTTVLLVCSTLSVLALKPRTFTEKHIAEVVQPLHQDDAFDHFSRNLLAPLLTVRAPGTAGHQAANSFIRATLHSLGWLVTEDVFEDETPRGRQVFRNIIATKNPKAPRRLILAAHYDSKIFDDFEFIGATDSAGSCAALLQLATLLNERLNQQARFNDITLELLFFDGEEAVNTWSPTDSIYGARHLAAQMALQPSKQKRNADTTKTALDDIDLFILLDLLGYAQPQVYNFYERTSSSYARLTRIETRLRLRKLLLADSRLPFFANKENQLLPNANVEDDHKPFLDRGVAVVHLIPLPFPPVWHKQEDNADAIDVNTLLDWTQILAVFVAEYLDLA